MHSSPPNRRGPLTRSRVRDRVTSPRPEHAPLSAAGIQKHGKASNLTPSSSPTPATHTPNNLDPFFPEYTFELALRELVVLRGQARALEDRHELERQRQRQREDQFELERKRQRELEDLQVQERLAKRERENEILFNVVEAAVSQAYFFASLIYVITNCFFQATTSTAGGGDSALRLRQFADDLALSITIEKTKTNLTFESPPAPTSPVSEGETLERGLRSGRALRKKRKGGK
jgi:hypothetical protein